jgi:hypothetical protein
VQLAVLFVREEGCARGPRKLLNAGATDLSPNFHCLGSIAGAIGSALCARGLCMRMCSRAGGDRIAEKEKGCARSPRALLHASTHRDLQWNQLTCNANEDCSTSASATSCAAYAAERAIPALDLAQHTRCGTDCLRFGERPMRREIGPPQEEQYLIRRHWSLRVLEIHVSCQQDKGRDPAREGSARQKLAVTQRNPGLYFSSGYESRAFSTPQKGPNRGFRLRQMK